VKKESANLDNTDLSVLQRICEWRSLGHAVVIGTLIQTWGSAPRPVGSIVAIRDDGHIAGSVSGGCIEADLSDRVRQRGRDVTSPQRVTYGVSAEEANRFGLPCGGTIELVLESVCDQSRIEDLLIRLEKGECIRRTLDLRSGRVTLEPQAGAAVLCVNDASLTTYHGPTWRLLVIGAGQMSEYLASMARTLDYEVTVCDPREEYADEWSVSGTQLVQTMPDDTVLAMRPDPHTAIVALTHDPKLDDLALIDALKSDAFYVGAIGSRKNHEKRRARLLEFDVLPHQIDRLFSPVGLKNGARTPPEIAVAILAQMTAARYGYRIPHPTRQEVDPRADPARRA
jgi:xanthine dehydrogenase accessory factor